MTAVASEGVPGTRHQLRRRLRATVLGPRGGGTTRRRASDAFRLGLAVVVVRVSIPVMRANSTVELSTCGTAGWIATWRPRWARWPFGPTPQVAQHHGGDQGLLVTAGQRAEVDDDTADGVVVYGVENRALLAASPHRVAVDAQVRQAQPEAACLGQVTSGQRLKGRGALAGQEGGQGGVLVAVGDRVQAQRCRLGRRVDLGRVQP